METSRAMLEEHKLIVICRGVYGDTLCKTMEALYKGGIRLAEVTFDQKSKDYTETLDAITMLEKHFRGRMAIGAGTVINTEVLNAHEYGADYVKLFPAARMGASYIRDLMGPISHVKFIATAGITEENIAEFASIGCTGYGISGRLLDKQVIQEGRFEELQHRAEAFIACLQKKEE